MKKLRPVTVADQRLAARCAKGRVVVIDDDAEILKAFALLFDLEGYACETYATAERYLDARAAGERKYPGPVCLLCDVKMPAIDGLELQRRLSGCDDTPLLLMSGASGAQEAVDAFRGGAFDFLIKPIDSDELLAAVGKALDESRQRQARSNRSAELADRVATLTTRERQVVKLVADGIINREIAAELQLQLRTVKLYRQRAMEKLGAETLADLVRIVGECGLRG